MNLCRSATCHKQASCIVRPEETSQLQRLVQRLVENDVRFAVRSGGHSPNLLAAAIEDGILIDMSGFDEVTIDKDNGVVVVGSGQRWGDKIFPALTAEGLMAVGGRVPAVGVGGFLQGTGLSYLSGRYGLACDNVKNFEVILSDGSLVNANTDENPDLFKAMKGTGNQFGIVTRFTIYTYPLGQIWGGQKFYGPEQLPALLQASLEFQQNAALHDVDASIMLLYFPTGPDAGGVLSMVYLKPEANPPAFAPFENIPTTDDNTKIQSLTSMIAGAPVPPNPRWDWWNVNFRPTAAIYDHFQPLLQGQPVETISSVKNSTIAVGLNSIGPNVIQRGIDMGGNLLGNTVEAQTWFAINAGWANAADDETVHTAGGELIRQMRDVTIKEGEHIEWLFPNEANHDQQVTGSFGVQNVEELRRVRDKYDPQRVYQRLLPGGFKIPGS
ncbi:putative FAD-binding oxidoreductase [Pseudovirgaria hyperparasitica]|uniref:Putative FAD-binding oxidoreductase n=1 Tax=Pseudovirgaria hyperparasitica TaxID=470096 RepID=A0A6A6VUU3_9PEZI|nr:putative FAD-binding oxidoreductase [Pseudovirgaria hyperparasitica]KAF2753649.1 putative FAD-binding oxidoreductase [Pseudovirgaria hyperparasitica]